MERPQKGCQGLPPSYRSVTQSIVVARLPFMPSPAPLVVGSFSPSVLLRVARRTGALADRGMDVREEPVPSSPAQFRALADGALDAALTSPDNVVAYRFLADNPLGGARDVRIVAAVDRGLGLALYARPGVTSVADLRGSTVGVDVAASGFAFALFEVLDRAGLGRGDYELAELGSTPKRLDALLEGTCAATMLNAGNDLKADDAGLVRLVDVLSIASPYLGTVLAVQGDPSPAVRSLAAALLEAADGIRDGTFREAAAREAAATGLAPHLAERYVERLLDPDHGLVPGGSADRESLSAVVDLRRRHVPPQVAELLKGAVEPASGLVDAASGCGR
jgi:ABC-type nitrate/sulfonate/bicarbonate transport system substrate-binding protein